MENQNFTALNDYFCEKSNMKQDVYKKTLEAFRIIKDASASIIDDLKAKKEDESHELDLHYNSIGSYEAELMFAGDALSIQMHTNVFAFPQDHFINNLSEVKKDKTNGYVGMILIYNFLADSLRYKRIADVGYLIGRIFINKEGNYFVDGQRTLSFLYQNFENQKFDSEAARNIIQAAMKQAIDFDLFVPPYDQVKEVSLQQKIVQQGNTSIKTGKRLGFIYNSSEND
ncbi:MAG: hypothetical protein JXQ87_12580 [Bacteroidia bacterium]